MKNWKFFLKWRGVTLLFAFLMVIGCGNAERKAVLHKAVSEVYSELEKSTEQSSQDEQAQDENRSEDEAAVEGNSALDGVEIPVYKGKTKLSETIKHRYSYVVSYNHDTREPNWVAWKLTAAHASGSVARMDFQDDDDMPAPKGYLSDYYNSGYDRGHMCPAGDNKWSEKAMEDCFLITNMCPQDGGLNRGMWNSIEQQCRAWAKKYGVVYIVCGPIYLNKEHRKLGKNKVVVPDAFFKVVLCPNDKPKAIGFVCRNESQKGKKKTDFINTIDDVERITGYDFFSKLPDAIEDKVESHADINEW